jgi:hypothetical protein
MLVNGGVIVRRQTTFWKLASARDPVPRVVGAMLGRRVRWNQHSGLMTVRSLMPETRDG